jgi:large subunit ribosomal protein L18
MVEKNRKGKIIGTKERPRLVISRSNRSMFAQIIDDVENKTIIGMSTLSLKMKATKKEQSFKLGENVAKEALKKGVKKVSFDRNNYRYLGRVKAFAEGARKGGLEF